MNIEICYQLLPLVSERTKATAGAFFQWRYDIRRKNEKEIGNPAGDYDSEPADKTASDSKESGIGWGKRNVRGKDKNYK